MLQAAPLQTLLPSINVLFQASLMLLQNFHGPILHWRCKLHRSAHNLLSEIISKRILAQFLIMLRRCLRELSGWEMHLLFLKLSVHHWCNHWNGFRSPVWAAWDWDALCWEAGKKASEEESKQTSNLKVLMDGNFQCAYGNGRLAMPNEWAIEPSNELFMTLTRNEPLARSQRQRRAAACFCLLVAAAMGVKGGGSVGSCGTLPRASCGGGAVAAPADRCCRPPAPRPRARPAQLRVCECVSVWARARARVSLSEWVSEWGGEWDSVSEWVSEWMRSEFYYRLCAWARVWPWRDCGKSSLVDHQLQQFSAVRKGTAQYCQLCQISFMHC